MQGVPALDKGGDLLHLLRPFGGVAAAVHPAAEERQVRQVNPAQRVAGHAGDERQRHPAHEAHPQRQQPQRRVLRALQKLAMIIWRLLVHAVRGQFSACMIQEHKSSEATLHPLRRGGFFFEPPQQRLAEVNEPRLAPAFLRRLVRARHLQNLDQPPRIGGHQEHPVAQINRLLHRVGHQEHRALLLVPQLDQQLLHPQADARVQGAKGLVHEQDARLENQRGGDGHALLHAAGELGRELLLRTFQADLLHPLRRPVQYARSARRPAASGRRRYSRAHAGAAGASISGPRGRGPGPAP